MRFALFLTILLASLLVGLAIETSAQQLPQGGYITVPCDVAAYVIDKGETFRADPILELKTSVTEGSIKNVSPEIMDGRSTLKIEFKPDGGAPVSFIYPRDSNEVNSLANIGDFSANRVYPSGVHSNLT